jgi:hypothetical protein
MKLSKYYLLLLILGLAGFALVSSSAGHNTRSLARTEDHILFTGADVPSLIGAEITDLHCYAFGPSGFKAIPFQVDKRDSEGRYVFPDEKIRDPLRDGTELDENDELVFMIKDAGDRCRKKTWVEKAVRGVEIEILDPLDGGRAWVYLFDRPGAEKPETGDYVSFQLKGDGYIISSDNFEAGMKLNKLGMHQLRLRRPDGTWGPDILDRLEDGVKGRLLNGAIPVSVQANIMRNRILGVIDGPVRVIKNELSYVKAIGELFSNEYFVVYYFNGQTNPVKISVPFTFHKLFLEVSMFFAIDYNEEIMGSEVRNDANPGGIILDGKPDPGMDDETETSYVTVSGPNGSLIDIWIKEETLAEMLRTSTYVQEDLSERNPREDHPGQLTAGLWAKSAKKLLKGTYHYWLYHYFPYPFSDKKVKEIFNMIEHPVRITVRPIALKR